MRARGAEQATVPTLAERLAALSDAAGLAEGKVAPDLLAAAYDVVEHAGTRMRLAPQHTFVALAGATGSGKSSVLNALAGQDVARTGVLRPTTAQPVAAVFDDNATAELADALSWLEVTNSTGVSTSVGADAGPDTDGSAGAVPAGLVVLDLPDHDSVERAHHRTAERLIERADLIVWVLDPQKYADDAIHSRFLAPLSGHRDLMVLVLNQIDRLDRADAQACLEDLSRLATADGLEGIRILGASTRTGQGVDDLRNLLIAAARERSAAVARLGARITDVAAAIADACDAHSQRARHGRVARAEAEHAAPERALEHALARAAGVDRVVAAVHAHERQRARAATGWPVTRWLGRFRIDPLRRLNLHRGPDSTGLTRTSLPELGGADRAALRVAVREYGAAVTGPIPEAWEQGVHERLEEALPQLPDRLDTAVASADLGIGRQPRWWGVLTFVQWVLFAVLVTGVAWLTVLGVFSYFRLPQPHTPEWERIPWPTLLVLAGAASGIVLSLIARVFAGIGARRSARRARASVTRGVVVVADQLIHEPVRAELTNLTRCREAALLAMGRSAAGDSKPQKEIHR